MTLGDRLRILREAKRLSQTELAQTLGIPNQSISNYERNYRKPPFDLIEKFADYHQVSMDYLLGRQAYLHPPSKIKDLKTYLAEGPILYDDIPLDQNDLAFIRQMVAYIAEKKKD
ncbi:helix-turn-helix transcriptional regulator [Hazenella sp. IB182357]|uniref:Helix-turn-helix transcriptional regulator n=1 Tax=Polycladospora coralii TaxID=2771432 RepID=A0A926RTG3_9BACL|nr:helix-turn-helix transcriptional regulator [Polycladospora coralii]MBD1371129.1 helix-turn-helix transcriptional regulator [Polycladospora coralii]MBS7530071.1 helix-turn-helix transcriptional regulator [Polycladospora coralii]